MGSATGQQKSYVKDLLKRAEFDERVVTLMYRQLNVPEKFIGSPLDHYLDSLSTEEISRLINRIREYADED